MYVDELFPCSYLLFICVLTIRNYVKFTFMINYLSAVGPKTVFNKKQIKISHHHNKV